MSHRVCNPRHRVHRVVKRGKKAPARNRGEINRRVGVLETFWSRGPNSDLTRVNVEKESLYHFTKGRRVRSK